MAGPNACAVCGPTIAGCWRCGSKLGHAHTVVYGRTGDPVGTAVVCRAHGPQVMGDVPTWALRPAPTRVTQQDVPRKRWLDRTYRKAATQLRQRYADEFARLLDAARSF